MAGDLHRIRSHAVLLVNISNLPWVAGRLKRNQAIFTHLLAASARLEAGIYIEPAEVDRASAASLLRPPGLRLRRREQFGDKPVTVLRPVHTYPGRYREGVGAAAAACVHAQLRRRYLRGRPYVLWMNSPLPLAANLARQLAPGAALRVFDSSDDFATFEVDRMTREVPRLLALADKVVCVNEYLAAKLAHPARRVFRNCTDFDNFQRSDPGFALPPWFPKPPGAVYIGFTGGLNSNRADFDLLAALFRRFPEYRFLFIGYSNDPALVARVQAFPNTDFIPEIPYTDLPSAIRAFDVAIVPHLDNEHTRANDLLKVLDYMACGVPVVTTPVSNVEAYGRAVYLAADPETFAARVEQLARGTLRHDPEPGRAIARSRSWALQVPELAGWIGL